MTPSDIVLRSTLAERADLAAFIFDLAVTTLRGQLAERDALRRRLACGRPDPDLMEEETDR